MVPSHKSRTAMLISVNIYTGRPCINTSNPLKFLKDRCNSSDTFHTGLNTEANVPKLLHHDYISLSYMACSQKILFHTLASVRFSFQHIKVPNLRSWACDKCE
jgi:hypothetical protein